MHLIAFRHRSIDKQERIDAKTGTTTDNQSYNMLKKHLKMSFKDVVELTDPAIEGLQRHFTTSCAAATDFFKANPIIAGPDQQHLDSRANKP